MFQILIYPEEKFILILVFAYLGFLVVAGEFMQYKGMSKSLTRKFIHVLAGLIVIPAVVLMRRPTFGFIISLSFAILAFLTSPASPVKSLQLKSMSEGHALGTTYYALSLFLLFLLFFKNKVSLSIGVLAMCFGDGVAALVGPKWKLKEYSFLKATRTLGGFLGGVTSIVISSYLVMMIYYSSNLSSIWTDLFLLFIIAFLSMITEWVSIQGLDNITVPIIASTLTYFLYPI